MKVLHINYALERGGIETWLNRLVRCFDPGEFEFSLAYHRGGSASMAAELQSAGIKLLELPSPREPVQYLRAYRKLLREKGPFHAVHSHLNFAGLMMLGAKLENVPSRIVQSHVSPKLMTRGLLAGSYARLTNYLFLRHMTQGIGVSPDAATTLFGSNWQQNGKIIIEPCGIDLTAFEEPEMSISRTSLGLKQDDLVLGMIGRLSSEKNQAFAFELVASLRKLGKSPRLLLIGEGTMRGELELLARQLGIAQSAQFLGERSDIQSLLPVLDVLLMPSTTEGAPLTVIEAQAAGVPCVVSHAIPQRSIVCEEMVAQIGLTEGNRAWADAVCAIAGKTSADSATRLQNSNFDIRHNARLLDGLYRDTPANI